MPGHWSAKRSGIFLLFALSLFAGDCLGRAEFILPDSVLMDLISPDLTNRCDSELMALQNDPDSAECHPAIAAAIRSKEILEYNGEVFYAVIAGCVGWGELFLINPGDSGIALRSAIFNIPTHYVGIDKILDVNGDKIPEIAISIGSGSHGIYEMFLSIYDDRLQPIYAEYNYHLFFAPGGRIDIKDLDADGIFELLLYDMQWPGDTGVAKYDIYKWTDGNYRIVPNSIKANK